MDYPTFNPFLIGCIGALAPEIIRLYKLRFNPSVRWSWSYLLFSIPFILLGGFMAYILEPTTSYAAFYTGVSTPFIVTTLTKDAERETQAIQRLPQEKKRLQVETNHQRQHPPGSSNDIAISYADESYLHYPDVSNSSVISDHSALRGTGLPSVAISPSPLQYRTGGGRFSQPSSRPSRFRVSKKQTFQSFLKAL